MKFEDLKEFEQVFFSPDKQKLFATLENKLYELQYADSDKIAVDVNGVVCCNGYDFDYYLLQSNGNMVELSRVRYTDSFYIEFEKFKQYLFYKDVVRYIVCNFGQMSFVDGYIAFDEEINKYVFTKFVEIIQEEI